MHLTKCVSADRPCRQGGPASCRRCPFRDDRTEDEKYAYLVSSWVHALHFGSASDVGNVPSVGMGRPLQADVKARMAETELVEHDPPKDGWQRFEIVANTLTEQGEADGDENLTTEPVTICG